LQSRGGWWMKIRQGNIISFEQQRQKMFFGSKAKRANKRFEKLGTRGFLQKVSSLCTCNKTIEKKLAK
jgi:hypothetical protein